MNFTELEKKYKTEAALMAAIDELKSALYEHQKYAQECRGAYFFLFGGLKCLN